MDIQVETTSRNMLFLVAASSSKIFTNQASDKALQTHIQSTQRHKQKLFQSKHFLELDISGCLGNRQG